MTKLLRLAVLAIASILVQSLTQPVAQGADGAQLAPGMQQAQLQHTREEARALFLAAQFDQAAQKWNALCGTACATSYDYYWLGESQYHLGKMQEAAASFEYALQKGPQLDLVYSRLAETYLAIKQCDKLKSTCTNGLSLVRDPAVRAQLEMYARLAGRPLPKPTRSQNDSRGHHGANG